MKSLKESLFDDDLVTSELTTLYDLFGSHIKKFQHSYSVGLGWTHYFDQAAVVREWKKEGRLGLGGGFAKSTFPSDLQKFVAIILNNTIITKKEIINMPSDGIFNDVPLNDKLEEIGVILPEGQNWGRSYGRRLIRVCINYIEGIPAGPDHGVQRREVGSKRIKGLNTDKIEISIYAYDPKRAGFGSHVWTILTDLSINDLK